MGAIADDILCGLMCESCGCLIIPEQCINENGDIRPIMDDDLPGYPIQCADCLDEDEE